MKGLDIPSGRFWLLMLLNIKNCPVNSREKGPAPLLACQAGSLFAGTLSRGMRSKMWSSTGSLSHRFVCLPPHCHIILLHLGTRP